ncbi:tRNA (adenosine(37)-N6)-dimethylallyltransferase MiaA [Picosynechococcus sp. PCC 7003]|uniref:tRNA (adenosine(37)-N6)-dimethylallyltransferase MiaA n=1 Tax=Picosynechococcus sp. PCC 7003 TaxID=374981 RepID=UPI000810A530|nr:tRNA (adenosine(37)-N6)-dimethylallyltransferase MiaA [Picosynechococcus sp. PCC 7003]ANV84094.1 tRNA (adenosine(37)-N6)-dimethylallyltransferase MiaA [Picosynechococcus sp. PCC 7003]
MTSPIIVICGATATGKSGLALKVAEKLDTVILSADSRQIYKEFDIGTAKPTPAEQQSIPHYLIDICEPTETLTLAEYQTQTQALIAQFHAEKKPVLLVGGTGLYIKAITKGLKIPRVSPQPELRQQFTDLGQAYSYQLLQQLDPEACQKIHPNDQVRTLRALEVFYVTGKPISHQQGENPPSYPILEIGLDCNPDHLDQRIQQRTQQMVDQGFVTEVEHLGKKYGWDLPLLNTLGYAEFREYVQGQGTLEEAIANTVLHTRQFAKRQRTWFRANPDIHWLDNTASDLLEQALNLITQQ